MERKKGHLTREERVIAYGMREKGKSLQEIGEAIGRDKSVLSREFRRNEPKKAVSQFMTPYEKASEAQEKAKRRRSDSKRGKKGSLKLVVVRDHIKSELELNGTSPEAIAGELPQFFPDKSVSGKTIRRWIKSEARGLIKCLRERGKSRRAKVTKKRQVKKAAPEKKRIDERPQVVQEHTESGHHEYDLITCSQSTTSILTIRELKSRNATLMLVPNREAETVNGALAAHFFQLPKALRKTATNDNGSEFAHAYKLEERYKIDIFYCHPYCAWERGSVENANKLIRWYLPKGTDLSTITLTQLKEIERKINNRPMECLNWKRPINVFKEEVRLALEQEMHPHKLPMAA